MSRITGLITMDFDTGGDITEKQFDEFERKFRNKLIDDWEMMVYDLAENCGFDANDVHPVMVEEVECEYED